jgi:hypothetical protein
MTYDLKDRDLNILRALGVDYASIALEYEELVKTFNQIQKRGDCTPYELQRFKEAAYEFRA